MVLATIGTSSYRPTTGVTSILVISFRAHARSGDCVLTRFLFEMLVLLEETHHRHPSSAPMHTVRCGCMLVLRIVPLHGHVSVINDKYLVGSVVAGVAVPRVDHVAKQGWRLRIPWSVMAGGCFRAHKICQAFYGNYFGGFICFDFVTPYPKKPGCVHKHCSTGKVPRSIPQKLDVE